MHTEDSDLLFPDSIVGVSKLSMYPDPEYGRTYIARARHTARAHLNHTTTFVFPDKLAT